MAKTRIGSNATFTGAQKGLTILGSHCMAYSGVVIVNNTETDLCNFTTGKGYIIAQVHFSYMEDVTESYLYSVYFNGIKVQGFIRYGKKDYKDSNETPLNIMIPPLTQVRLTADNISDSNARGQLASLVGRVYDA